MRIECQCGEKAVVRRSEQSERTSLLYCSCINAECGHSFVSTLDFKRSTWAPGQNRSAFVDNARIYCGCGSRANIQKTNRFSKNVADIYCICAACQHRFVMTRSFTYTLSQSASQSSQLVMAIIKAMTPTARHSLSEQLNLF